MINTALYTKSAMTRDQLQVRLQQRATTVNGRKASRPGKADRARKGSQRDW